MRILFRFCSLRTTNGVYSMSSFLSDNLECMHNLSISTCG